MTLKVVETLYVENIRDIPAMLRRCADDIENETYGAVDTVIPVMVMPGDPVKIVVAELGDDCGDRFRLIGILQAAIKSLLDDVEMG